MLKILKTFIYIPFIFVGAITLIDGLLPTRSLGPNPSIIEVIFGAIILVLGLYMRRKTVKTKTYKEIKREKS
jgi:hypothetical protein